jgi:hypothetical protein
LDTRINRLTEFELKSLENLLDHYNTLLGRISNEFKESNHIYQELITDLDWEKVSDCDGIICHFKHEDNSPVYSMKMSGEVDAPMLNVVSIFYEIDLYPVWCPYMTYGKKVKEDSKYTFLCQYEYDLPWPISKRDMFANGRGIDMIETDRSILVTIKSVKEEVSSNSTVVRMQVDHAGILIKAISDKKTLITIVTNVDPKLSYVPYFLFNYLLKNSGYYILSYIRKTCAKMLENGQEHKKRIEENHEIYQDIQTRLDILTKSEL